MFLLYITLLFVLIIMISTIIITKNETKKIKIDFGFMIVIIQKKWLEVLKFSTVCLAFVFLLSYVIFH